MERYFVRKCVSVSVTGVIYRREMKCLRANLIDPVIDQSYWSQRFV